MDVEDEEVSFSDFNFVHKGELRRQESGGSVIVSEGN
jgi:hypothetical protein